MFQSTDPKVESNCKEQHRKRIVVGHSESGPTHGAPASEHEPCRKILDLLVCPAGYSSYGKTIRARKLPVGLTDHHTDSLTGISRSHEMKIAPNAKDHEKSGGLGLIPPGMFRHDRKLGPFSYNEVDDPLHIPRLNRPSYPIVRFLKHYRGITFHATLTTSAIKKCNAIIIAYELLTTKFYICCYPFWGYVQRPPRSKR